MWICNRRLYRTQEGFLVEEGDPRGIKLAYQPGFIFAAEPEVAPTSPPSPLSETERGSEEEIASQARNDKSEEGKAIKPAEDKAVRPSTSPPAPPLKGEGGKKKAAKKVEDK